MKVLKVSLLLLLSLTILFCGNEVYGGPKGAKALFDSGEGPSTVASVTQKQAPTQTQVAKEKYVGIAYQLMLLKPDGSFTPVSRYRTFKSGERLKILVRTNRPGYLTIMNIGPTGNTHVLFDEYVEAFNFVEIPRGSNLVFAGPAGTEKLLIMLSDGPNPITNRQGTTVQAPPPSTPSAGSTPPSYTPPPSTPPSQGSIAGATPPPGDLIASLEGAKSMRGSKGSKDLVVEDNMKSTYAVISPQTGYKPVSKGSKDIIVESSQGVNYGVVPVSAIAGGGMLTLQINLTHK